MSNLLISVLKHLSVNEKGYQFFKNTHLNFSMKFCPIGTNFNTLACLGVYYTKFLYCLPKTVKMGIHTTKGGFFINCRHESNMLSRYF